LLLFLGRFRGDFTLNGGGSLTEALNSYTDGTGYPADWKKWAADSVKGYPVFEDDVSEEPSVPADPTNPVKKYTASFNVGPGAIVLFDGKSTYETEFTGSLVFTVICLDGSSILSVHASSGTLTQTGNDSYILSGADANVSLYVVTEKIPDTEADDGKYTVILIAIAAVAAMIMMMSVPAYKKS
jgi:hypothetical protein